MNNYKIYCLTNIITNEKYIGVTKQKIYKRFKAGKGYKPKTKINQAILKYGWENFSYNVLFETEDKELAGNIEKNFIALYDTIKNGYNILTGGFNNFTGYKPNKEVIEKSKQEQKGKHYSIKTEWKKGIYNETSRNKKVPVLCVELNQTFESIKQAEEKFNVHHIWDCINGKRNKCGNYHWKLAKEVE